jgi:hypothetical protein
MEDANAAGGPGGGGHVAKLGMSLLQGAAQLHRIQYAASHGELHAFVKSGLPEAPLYWIRMATSSES